MGAIIRIGVLELEGSDSRVSTNKKPGEIRQIRGALGNMIKVYIALRTLLKPL